MRSIEVPFEEWQLPVADAVATASRCSCRTELSVPWIGEGCRHSLPFLEETAKRVMDRASPPSQIYHPIPADTTTSRLSGTQTKEAGQYDESIVRIATFMFEIHDLLDQPHEMIHTSEIRTRIVLLKLQCKQFVCNRS
jgi:hypothetical protein